MKKRIYPILALLICLSISHLCFAQKATYKKRTAEEKARYYTNQMTDSLDLNSEQEEKVYSIHLIVSQAFDSLYAHPISDPNERKIRIRKIFETRDEDLRKVLTTKQFLRFKDIELEKYERKKALRKERGEE